MNKLLGDEWWEILKDEFNKDYMINLSNFVSERREQTVVFPPKEDVFNAYKYTPYSKVKVCIIGMDPYIKEGEAMGISFSTKNNKYTPSLRQIEKAVREYWIKVEPESDQDWIWQNNLTDWTEQGVMMLNAVLTVDKGKSNSHKGKGWEIFTKKTIEELDKKGDVIFLLWGKDAQVLKENIKNSTVIESEHPVAAVYRGGTWDCNDCFNKVNQILKNKIVW